MVRSHQGLGSGHRKLILLQALGHWTDEDGTMLCVYKIRAIETVTIYTCDENTSNDL
jgi:hypothetical protein